VAKAFLIRDPIHGYIQVAAHERILVDAPITQRLRRINQTGLADLVYPEARTSRFAHSLGAMHLASRFLIACIENAVEQDAVAFFEELENLDLFRNFSLDLADMDNLLFADRLEGGGLKAARAVFRHPRLRRQEKKYRRLLGLAEAGLRLAALFHDLGHLPFSHDMEFALEEYVGTKKRAGKKVSAGIQALIGGPPHEVIGHNLANLVFQTSLGSRTSPSVRAAFGMARKILEVAGDYYDQPRPNAGVVPWLHSLVDGEVDVDRADYLLRDARALGFEFAIYDLERLINNLALVQHHELGFATAIEERGFSALETFYLSRSRSNQFLVRHHKVAQIAAAFRYIAVTVLDSPRCHGFLETIERLGQNKKCSNQKARNLLADFGNLDDTWWLYVLRNADYASDPLFGACRDLILNRKATLVSMWKRKGDLSREQKDRMNHHISENLSSVSAIREKFRQMDMLIIFHKFRPIRTRLTSSGQTESVMLLRTGEGSLLPVSNHSALLNSLFDAWNEDVHFHVFRLPNSTISAQTVERSILELPGYAKTSEVNRTKSRKSAKKNGDKEKRIKVR
jgi:HD superfamily phosphohydrolase